MGEVIKIHPMWLEGEENEKALMKRLHQIISGNGDGPFRLKHEASRPHRWQLDSSNDWWAEIQGKDLVLSCRYNAEKLKAFASFAQFVLE
jgi:hypothetical protein